MRRRVVVLTAMLIGGVGVGAANAAAPSTEHPRVSTSSTTDLPTASSYDIANTRGGVTITSGSKATVVSNATYTLTPPKVVVTNQNGTVKVTVDCSGLLGTITNQLLPNDCHTNLVVTLPTAAAVHATTDASPLTVSNMTGTLKLFSQSGPLSLSSSSGKSQLVATGSSAIVVDHVSSPSLTVESNSGDITVKTAFSQNFTAGGSSGTIRVQNSSLANLTSQTDSGAQSYTAVASNLASFVSGAGAMTLHGMTVTNLSANSQAGKVDVSTTLPPATLSLTTQSSAIVASVPKTDYQLTISTSGTKSTNLKNKPNATRTISATSKTGAITITGR